MTANDQVQGAVLDATNSSVLVPPGPSDVSVDGIEVLPATPSQVDTTIFQNATRFRTRLVALAVVVGLLAGYAVIGVVSIFSSASQPATAGIVVVQPLDRLVASNGSTAAPGGGCSQIQGAVFIDERADGIRTHDEEGLVGVGVSATGGEGQVVATATTAADGSYSLVLPQAMPVAISLDLDSADWVALGLWPGPRRLSDTGATQLLDREPCLAFHGMRRMSAGGDHPTMATLEGGLVAAPTAALPDLPGVQLHGRIWLDRNRDAAFIPGEETLVGVQVELREGDGSVLAVATSGVDGLYMFSNLEPNHEYSVNVVHTTHEFLGVNGLGRTLPGVAEATVTFQTSDGGLAVWGLDFFYDAGGSAG